MTWPLGTLARRPVQYYHRTASAIRLLSLGILINKAGTFVAVFLAIILAMRHIPTDEIGIALIASGVCAIAGAWIGAILISRIGTRLTLFLSMVGSAVFTAALAFPSPFPVTVVIVSLITLFNRGYVPAAQTMIGRVAEPDQRVQMYALYQRCLNVGSAIGPTAAGFLITRSLTALLLIDAATSLAFGVLCLRVPADHELPADAPQPDPEPGQRPRRLRDDRK